MGLGLPLLPLIFVSNYKGGSMWAMSPSSNVIHSSSGTFVSSLMTLVLASARLIIECLTLVVCELPLLTVIAASLGLFTPSCYFRAPPPPCRTKLLMAITRLALEAASANPWLSEALAAVEVIGSFLELANGYLAPPRGCNSPGLPASPDVALPDLEKDE